MTQATLAPMDARHLAELAELEDGYWWHVAKRRLAVQLLTRYAPPPGLLVEGGVGSSRNLLEFRRLGYDVTGLDVMPEAVDLACKRGVDSVQLHDLETTWPVDDGSARAVVLLDVIEHLADPVLALEHAWCALQPGGALVVTVPAYPCLYGDWDRALGHYRRYTAPLLREQAEQAGFRIRLLTHWNSFTLPAAIAVRGWRRMFPQHGAAEFPRVSLFTNRLLLACAAAERALIGRIPVPCGLSHVGVLVK
jgi:SAM-dependent methyltransferase